MRKLWMILIILIASVLFLSACSDDEDSTSKDENADKEITASENEESGEEPAQESIDDQLELTLGDTGVFDTTLGTYEVTLDAAELKGKEFEGVKSTRDDIILLDLTIKNTSDEALDAEELIESMEVADDLDGAGSGDNAIGFDTLDAFEGEIEPGEEMTGHFLTTVNTADTYYFRKNPGNVAAGTSNQVIWTIEEADLE